MGTGDGTVIGTTQILNNGPTSSRFNLVLLSEGYQAGADMTQWQTNAQQFVDYLRGTPPFDDPTVMARINAFRVDVASTDRGADKPAACFGGGASSPATYFDATYCAGGLQRLLVADSTIVTGVLTAQVPAWHQALVVVNDTEWGGSGGAIGVTSLSPGWEGIAVHEMGHSAFGLADEYEYYQGCGSGETTQNTYTGAEPGQPNITIDANRATNEWRALIDPATPMPTTSNANCAVCDPQANPMVARTVGAFEGGGYFHCGIYRPEFNCMMRDLTRYFCGACARTVRQTLRLFTAALRRVDVRAPDVNFVFSPSGTITVSDIAPPLTPNGASGAGFFQSRLYPRAPSGTPAAGNFGYVYRVALDGASGGGPAACVRSLSLDFGPVLSFDYDGSGTASQVFTVTQGGLGSVGPSAVELAGDRLTFTFDPPVCPGTTSFFFGLTSAHAPRDVIADVRDAAGNTYSLAAKAPAFP
jgi:IgA Peptidase M64